MNINEYLNRINFKGEIEIDETCLKVLHKCHIMAITFEYVSWFLEKRSLELNISLVSFQGLSMNLKNKITGNKHQWIHIL